MANFYDSKREGDGDRMMMLWKFLLLIFRQSSRKNYAKEAVILLIMFIFMISERVATQIMTAHFVNTKGREGCNLPNGLHLDHLNHRLKSIIRHL